MSKIRSGEHDLNIIKELQSLSACCPDKVIGGKNSRSLCGPLAGSDHSEIHHTVPSPSGSVLPVASYFLPRVLR